MSEAKLSNQPCKAGGILALSFRSLAWIFFPLYGAIDTESVAFRVIFGADHGAPDIFI